jgi:hypothetical protein
MTRRPRFSRAAQWLAAALLGAVAGHPAGVQASPEAAEAIAVTIATDDPQWVVGTAKRFTVTLRNVSAQPWIVDRFGGLNELYEGKRASTWLPSCWVLARLDGTALASVRRGRYTLEPGQFTRLEPGESVEQSLSLTLPDGTPGAIDVRLAYMPRAASPSFSFPDHWEIQHGLQGAVWLGMAYSNPLTLHLRPADAAGGA